MDLVVSQAKITEFSKKIIIIVGGYGSGKSEVAVNLACYLKANQDYEIAIADLDIINPYFRSREAIKALTELGIKSIVPEGGQFYADLPIILPEIKGAIEKNNDDLLILDVGGDDTGSRVLSSLSDAFINVEYEMLLVLNARRPFTSNLEESTKMIRDIEKSSRLKFTGLISNTHLMENTTKEIILEGVELARVVSKKLNLPLLFVSGLKNILKEIDGTKLNEATLPLERQLLKPWEAKNTRPI
ncbi:MAG: cobalamin biosynthesis protein CbiA [candidate division Zixibacteria bacterium]|nr:cobalamin biosynthesis protein CbiA [candidate division Zixibacteria bacterium]